MTLSTIDGAIARRINISSSTIFLIALLLPTAVFVVYQLATDPGTFFQTMMKSLGLGSTYAILALGFVLIFKGTQVVNFAQGALGVAGALFLSFAIADGHIPLTTIENPFADIDPHWVAWSCSVVIALIFAAALGLAIERMIIRPMIGKPIFAVAIITLGLEIILRTLNNDTSESQFRSLEIPWGTGGFKVGDATIAWSYIAAMITAALCFVAVALFYRTRTGIAMRAVAQDQEAAMAQGINVGRVFAIAWAAGAVLAAIGGIFGTQPPVKQTGAVDPETANIAFRALPAVVLGGLDSALGALVGGLIIGSAEIFAGQYLAQWQNTLGPGYPLIVPYVVMLIGLIVRPYGLFGTPEIRRV
jgi:branched-chain amino acid transport system permease protein